MIESIAPERSDAATDAVERAMRARFGGGHVAGSTVALMVMAEKPLA